VGSSRIPARTESRRSSAVPGSGDTPGVALITAAAAVRQTTALLTLSAVHQASMARHRVRSKSVIGVSRPRTLAPVSLAALAVPFGLFTDDLSKALQAPVAQWIRAAAF
jgi:hypothetical protein